MLRNLKNPFNRQYSQVVLLVGLSAWFAWIHLLHYMEHIKSMQSLSKVLKGAGTGTFRFILGFIPIFMGYAFLGTCLFWYVEIFDSLNQSIMSLFSLLLGDMIFETYQKVSEIGILGVIYLFSFMIMFFVAVQNVFVSIMCEKVFRENKGNDEDEKTNKETLSNDFRKSIHSDSELKISFDENINNNKSNLKKINSLGTSIIKSKLRDIRKLKSLKPENEIDNKLNEEENELLAIEESHFIERINKKSIEINCLLDEFRRGVYDDIEIFSYKSKKKNWMLQKYKEALLLVLKQISSVLKVFN